MAIINVSKDMVKFNSLITILIKAISIMGS